MPDSLTERLLRTEPFDAQRDADLRARIDAVLREPISPAVRTLLGIIGLCMTGAAALLFTRNPAVAALDVRPLLRIIAAGFTAVGLLMIFISAGGHFDRRAHTQWLMAIVVIVLASLGCFSLGQGWATGSAPMLSAGEVCLGIVGFLLLLYWIERTRLSTTEHLLQLEHRMLMLSEKVTRATAPGQSRG